MNEHVSNSVDIEYHKASTLTERLDPSIGEVSTVMGAMMTELLRRALRGSVRQIDDELQGHVDQKLSETIAQRLPAIEESAAEAADKAARQAATEVAVEEVHALERRTTQTAAALVGKIELVEKNAGQAITTNVQELTSLIDEAAKSIMTLGEEKARALARDIEDAERRVNETARTETARQVEDVMQKARETAAGIKERLKSLETGAAALTRQVHTEADDRKAEYLALRGVIDKLQQDQSSLRRLLAEAQQQNEALTARVMELESPRGLRALWVRLFGRRGAFQSGAE